MYCSPNRVYITDIHEPTLDNAKHNIIINTARQQSLTPGINDFIRINPSNGVETMISLRNINWKNIAINFQEEDKVDILLGSDLVYDINILSILVPAIPQLLKPTGELLYVAPDTGRDGMEELLGRLEKEINMRCIERFPVPSE
jgi:predicted nicotinamide N-methyase